MSGHKRQREHDGEWLALLSEYGLHDKADVLETEGGVASSSDMLAMSESDAKELRKELKLLWRFVEMWRDIQAREKAAAFGDTIEGLEGRKDIAGLVRGLKKKEYATFLDVQVKGCEALGKLACDNVDNRIEIAEQDGIEVIMEAMRNHQSAEGVQQCGCYALGHLAWNNTIQIEIAEQGGIEVILGAMRQHQSVAGVQENGCLALGNLADENEHNRIQIAGLRGIEVILGAMRLHQNVADVQEWGCYALGNLADENDDNRIKIAEQGGIEVILGAMRQHRSLVGVQQWGCLALLCIGKSNQGLQTQMKTAGAEEVVRSAMAASNATPPTKKDGQLVLDMLRTKTLGQQFYDMVRGVWT